MSFIKNIFLFFLVIPLISCGSRTLHVKKAHSLFDKGSYTASISYYSKAIEENPSIADNFYFRGLAWLMKKEYDLAIADFSQTIELDNNYSSAYINRGTLWKKKGKLEKALSDYNKVIQLKPSILRALEERAELLFLKKQFSKAIIDYNTLIIKKYNLAKTYRQRADAKYLNGNYGGAIKDYSSSIMLNPKVLYAYNTLALLYATCVDEKYRNGEKAVYNAKKAVDIEYNKHTLYTLALAYAEIGMFNRSITILNKIIKKYDLNKKEIFSLKNHVEEFKNSRPLRQQPTM